MFRNPLIDAVVVLIALLLIFGPKRLPLLGRSLGQGMREFKDSIAGSSSNLDEHEPAALPQPAAAAAVAAPAASAAPAHQEPEAVSSQFPS